MKMYDLEFLINLIDSNGAYTQSFNVTITIKHHFVASW